MNIDQLKEKKRQLGYTNHQLSQLSGVPEPTIQKVFSGTTYSPRKKTIDALSKALSTFSDDIDISNHTDEVNETARVFKAHSDTKNTASEFYRPISVPAMVQGDKTLEDYIALPEGTRIEMIDGVFYDMSSPTTIHQFIAGEIHLTLKLFVRKNKGICTPFIAPTDVQLDYDDKTMVVPDVFVICNRDRITTSRVVGPPDLAIEILSPNNFHVDTMIKLHKYKKAGVREYWIINPQNKDVIVYFFENDSEPVKYTFEDEIPVGIWDGRCKVDFKDINQQIKELFNE